MKSSQIRARKLQYLFNITINLPHLFTFLFLNLRLKHVVVISDLRARQCQEMDQTGADPGFRYQKWSVEIAHEAQRHWGRTIFTHFPIDPCTPPSLNLPPPPRT